MLRNAPQNTMQRNLFSWVLYKVPFLLPFLEWLLYRFQRMLVRFYEDDATYALIVSVYRERRIRVQPFEALSVYQLATMRSRRPGAMAELGVAGGGTAKLICAAAGGKDFFGFDTFSGLPPVRNVDTYWGVRFFKEHQYAADEESVRKYLSPFQNVHLVRGVFPQSAKDLQNETFGFVHLDADLYESTRDGLQFFWPRMTSGGVILIHDAHAQGVKQAITEFIEQQAIDSCFKSVCSQFVFLKP
jgi:predicted O-methyltransferase YrrM